MLSRLHLGTRDDSNSSMLNSTTKEVYPELSSAGGPSHIELTQNDKDIQAEDTKHQENDRMENNDDQYLKPPDNYNQSSPVDKVCSLPVVLTGHNDGYIRFWNLKVSHYITIMYDLIPFVILMTSYRI